MESVPFGLTMIAVAWLVFWSIRDLKRPSKRWWPFDMRKPPEAKPVDDGVASRGRHPAGRRNAERPWQRSGF